MSQTTVSIQSPLDTPSAGAWRKPDPVLWAVRRGFQVFGRIAPKPAAKLAYRLWFTPRRKQVPTYEREWLGTADERLSLDFRGKPLAVHCWGQGPTVLLVHGWEGRGGQLAGFAAPLLGKGFRVVCFDAPAHGASGGKQTDAEEIRDAMLMLARREGGLHGVIAHSFGTVAAALALKGGLDLERAVFVSPPSTIEYFKDFFQAELGIPPSVSPHLIKLVEGRFPHLGTRTWEQFNTERNAAAFGIPGLVVHDREDTLVPFAHGERVAAAWPSARFLPTDGLGHRRILRDRGVILETAAFLAASS